jgi:hypothetical protein
MKISYIPKSGRDGSVVYVNGRYGKFVKKFVPPRNPRTREQQGHRTKVRAVSGRWGPLTPKQRASWCAAAADKYFVNKKGDQVRLNGYNFFVSLNTRRADLGLPQFDSPPAEPVFPDNPVVELVAVNTGDTILIKLRVLTLPAKYTLVQGPRPVRTSLRCVQHFPFLGLLPPPIDGWSDITELYVARHGVPKVGQAIWIRTCQHIDGWTDVPKVLRTRVLAAPP